MTLQPLSLWGMNANANALGDPEFFLQTQIDWRPAALLMMNGLEGTNAANIVVRASRLQEQWNGVTVYRPYEQAFEGRPWERPVSDHIAFLRRFQAPWLWYNVGNEPKPAGEAETRKMCQWYADLIRAAGDVRLVVVNFGVGTFERAHIQAGWYDALLIALAENAHKKINGWPQFMLGSHSTAYWHGLPSVHCAGRNPNDLIHPERLKEADWPTFEQIFDADTSNNWIVFRDWWFIERARWLRPAAEDIQIIATEAGPENLPNIRKQFPDVVRKMDEICGKETRGIPTIMKYLEWAFPGQSAEETLCHCYSFVQNRAPKLYRAFLTFSWTWHNAAPDYWKDNYNIGEQRAFLTRWPQFIGGKTTTPVPEPPPVIPSPVPMPPSAGDPRYMRMVLSTLGNKSHLRKYPDVDSESLLTFVGVEAKIIPPGMLNADEKYSDQLDDGTFAHWLPAIIGGVQGWVRTDAVELLLFEPPKPPPSDEEEPDTTPSEPSEAEKALQHKIKVLDDIAMGVYRLSIELVRLQVSIGDYADIVRTERDAIRESRLQDAA